MTSCKRSIARHIRVFLTPETVVTKHVKICYYIFLSMILVEIAKITIKNYHHRGGLTSKHSNSFIIDFIV